MAGIPKKLAVAAGAGVALGLCAATRSGRRPEARRGVTEIELLMERLEAIERRMETAEAAAADDIEQPERLRVLVDVRAEEIRQRFDAEIDERHRQALATVLNAVEVRIAARVLPIEQTLREHAASIHELRDHARDTDVSLKRLITSIERWCERTQPAAFAPPAPAPDPVVVPYGSGNQQEEAAPEFRSRIVMEEDAPRRPRFPLARMLGMIALVVFTQALSN